ncbi:class I adenylate-forming enzyme family protein [Nocardia sp. NPDC058640]|uniref:class I adenylate-forming enzyme family protein n=1 Tax=Nocardia sp. NPDC058640 TaxID=3346571 RepID=UPI0036569904
MAELSSFLGVITQLHDPDRTALQCGDAACTFGELADAARAWCHILSAVVSEGDVVIVDYEESAIDHTAMLLGVMAAGGVHMTTRTPRRAWNRLADSGRRWHAVTRSGIDTALTGLCSVVDRTAQVPLAVATPGAPPPPAVSTTSRGRILETSGSSGEPKWVYWAEDDLLADRFDWCEQVGLTSADIAVNIHPLDFAHGIDVHVLATLCVGAQTVHVGAGATMSTIVRTIRDVSATYMSALPAHYDSLARTCEASANIGEHLTIALTGGALLTPATAELVADRCGVRLRRLYGATEAGIMCADLRPELQVTPELSPLTGVQMRIRSIPGIDLDVHRVGEPVFHRAYQARGYWGDPERTAQAFSDGWYRSGDAVRLADDGTVSVLGRSDDVWVNERGTLCSSGALVDEISRIDDVEEVVVFAPGVDPGGRTVVLCRLSWSGAALQDIRDKVEATLTSCGLVGRIYLLSDWPKTSVGKPNRRCLLAWARTE